MLESSIEIDTYYLDMNITIDMTGLKTHILEQKNSNVSLKIFELRCLHYLKSPPNKNISQKNKKSIHVRAFIG